MFFNTGIYIFFDKIRLNLILRFCRMGMQIFGATGATFKTCALFNSFFKINRSNKKATFSTFVTPTEKGEIQC